MRTKPVGARAGGTLAHDVDPWLHVVLVHPEIPPNTGNVGRLCVGLGARLHLVAPLGFDIHEKAVRRAGLDYWRFVDLHLHADLDAFRAWLADRRAAGAGVWTTSSHARRPFTDAPFRHGDVLVFGRESVGLDPALLGELGGALRIPMSGPIRSLNLANAVSVVVYEAARRVRPELFAMEAP